MNILYTLDSGNFGGMEKHVLDLVEGMVAKGHFVFVWCREGELVDVYKSKGARVFIKKLHFDIDPFYILELIIFLKKHKIQVVHSHELKAASNALLAASIAGVRARITHVHTPISEWEESVPVKRLIRPFVIFWYSFLVNLLSFSEIALTESRKTVKIKEGIRPKKLRVIHNGIDLRKYEDLQSRSGEYRQEILQRYKVPSSAFILGNVSRMSQEKGHSILINAFAKLVKSGDISDNFYLLLAGGGVLENELRDLTKNLGIADKVIITGVFNEEDHVKFYATIDLFVFPTLAEGFGYVLVEAMSSRHPVVCSDLEVLKEVAGNTVKYFKTGDMDDLYIKIVETYKLFKSQNYVLDEAYNRVKNEYSLEKFVDKYEMLYREAQ